MPRFLFHQETIAFSLVSNFQAAVPHIRLFNLTDGYFHLHRCSTAGPAFVAVVSRKSGWNIKNQNTNIGSTPIPDFTLERIELGRVLCVWHVVYVDLKNKYVVIWDDEGNNLTLPFQVRNNQLDFQNCKLFWNKINIWTVYMTFTFILCVVEYQYFNRGELE